MKINHGYVRQFAPTDAQAETLDGQAHIRDRVCAAIADAYPALADEARRQVAERQAGL